MPRPMSRDDTRRLSVHLHGRRFALFIMAEKWVRHLEVYLPIAWDQVRQNLIENMALLEMQRRESQLPVRCLCEETYVLECVWRIVSNDEDRKKTEATMNALEAKLADVQEKIARQQELLDRPPPVDLRGVVHERPTWEPAQPLSVHQAAIDAHYAATERIEASLAWIVKGETVPGPPQAEPREELSQPAEEREDRPCAP